mgnify:CR=1 FL=1
MSGHRRHILVIGAATDYSLLIVSRYREELRRTEYQVDAMGRTLRGTWEPVLASGGTVALGVLTPAWRRFLDAYADRCLAGTDTYTPGRWADLSGLVEEARQWLAQLPDAQASRIVHDNAARLFGQPVPPGTP